MRSTYIQEREIDQPELESIRRAQQGDADAFESLYNSHRKRVYSLCFRMVRDTSDAEDLTQQTFLSVFRKINTFRGDSSFSTWLHRVAVNTVLQHLRKKKLVEVHPSSGNEANGESDALAELGPSDTSMHGAIKRINLMRAIRKLPAGYKRLFLLYDVLGYKHGEIAELVGCSIGCSKSQVHKARKRLQQLVRGEEPRVQQGICSSDEADLALI